MKDNTALLERTPESAEIVARPELPLLGVLNQIGARPFTPKSVVAYKKAMVWKRFQLWSNEPSYGWGVFFVILGFVLNTVLFYWLGVGLTSIFSLGFSLEYLGWLPLGCFVLCVISSWCREKDSLLILWVGSVILFEKAFGPSDLEWKVVSLKEHKKDIPSQVMERVGEIRMRCPKAQFFVDELQKKPDPFLVVSFEQEEYHVAVWFEPKFDGKCLV